MIIEKDTNRLNNYKPFEHINRADQMHLLNYIQQEHPQVIALILSQLEPKNASVILRNLPHEVQSDVTLRITCMGQVDLEISCEIARVSEKKLSTLSSEAYSVAGGVEGIVKILNLAGRVSQRQIIKTLEAEAPEIAKKIKKRSSVFWKVECAVRNFIRCSFF